MTANVTDVLRSTELFKRVAEPDLNKIAKILKERRVGRDQVLFRQGDAADSLYIVTAGRIRISASDPGGRERVLAFAGIGEVVGEMGLLSGEPRSATATAVTDSKLLQLRTSDFDALLAKNVDLMRELARVVAGRREATQQRALDQSSTGDGNPHGLVTALFSPRGGGGATTLATNLAVVLAQRTPDRVVVLDLNVLFGHVPMLLNVAPRTSLAAISPVSLRQMDRETLEFYLATHTDSSLRVLSSTLRPEEHELVTGEHVRAAIELLRRQFVHVVVDLSRGFSEVNLTAMEVAHNILIVCAPDRAGVRGVSETQRIARELLHFPADPLQYVLNHALPYAAVSAEQLEQALHMRLAATIPFGGDAVARAALEGHPVVSRFSSSETSKSVVALATRIDQQLAEARALGRPAQSDSRRVGWPRAY